MKSGSIRRGGWEAIDVDCAAGNCAVSVLGIITTLRMITLWESVSSVRMSAGQCIPAGSVVYTWSVGECWRMLIRMLKNAYPNVEKCQPNYIIISVQIFNNFSPTIEPFILHSLFPFT